MSPSMVGRMLEIDGMAIGVQSETHLPYAGLHQLLRPVLDRIDRLAPPQRDAIQAAFGLREAESPDLFLVGLGTLNLLTDEATDDGLLVIAEDAQWLDHGTGEVLAFVARRLGTDPVSLLIAIREGHESPLSVAGLSEMRLEGLDEAPDPGAVPGPTRAVRQPGRQAEPWRRGRDGQGPAGRARPARAARV